MLSLLCLMCIVLSVANIAYFSHAYNLDVMGSAESWIEVATQSSNQRWMEIRGGILDVAGSSAFSDIVNRIMKKEDESRILSSLQEHLDQLTFSCSLISTSYILSKGAVPFLSLKMQRKNNDSVLLDYDHFSSLSEPTMLPVEDSPFQGQKTVMPVVFPISFLSGSSYLMSGGKGEPDVIIVLLLDAQKIETELNQGKSSYFTSHCFLARTGMEEALDKESQHYFASSDYTVLQNTCAFPGIDIAYAVDISSYQPRQRAMITFCFLVVVLTLIIGGCSIYAISNFLMRPFSILMRMIDEIKRNCYKHDAIPKYNDETGALIRAINSMDATIHDQISLIKRTEKEKYQYMEQMLTEQINPHFIYNTLEVINMDVMNHDDESAASMIQDFSTFLRYSLNKGKDTTTFEDEAKQIESYVRIMNHRMEHPIVFSCTVSHELLKEELPKTILQPLVENSIRHGFHNGLYARTILIPTITVSMELDGKKATIQVTDNGEGIDIEKAKATIAMQETNGHIGLHNVYQRLSLYFGDVSISFYTIPCYRNSIVLSFPLKKDIGASL
jgi:two-component system sensor histidine kinase YesM